MVEVVGVFLGLFFFARSYMFISFFLLKTWAQLMCRNQKIKCTILQLWFASTVQRALTVADRHEDAHKHCRTSGSSLVLQSTTMLYFFFWTSQTVTNFNSVSQIGQKIIISLRERHSETECLLFETLRRVHSFSFTVNHNQHEAPSEHKSGGGGGDRGKKGVFVV